MFAKIAWRRTLEPTSHLVQASIHGLNKARLPWCIFISFRRGLNQSENRKQKYFKGEIAPSLQFWREVWFISCGYNYYFPLEFRIAVKHFGLIPIPSFSPMLLRFCVCFVFHEFYFHLPRCVLRNPEYRAEAFNLRNTINSVFSFFGGPLATVLLCLNSAIDPKLILVESTALLKIQVFSAPGREPHTGWRGIGHTSALYLIFIPHFSPFEFIN